MQKATMEIEVLARALEMRVEDLGLAEARDVRSSLLYEVCRSLS